MHDTEFVVEVDPIYDPETDKYILMVDKYILNEFNKGLRAIENRRKASERFHSKNRRTAQRKRYIKVVILDPEITEPRPQRRIYGVYPAIQAQQIQPITLQNAPCPHQLISPLHLNII